MEPMQGRRLFVLGATGVIGIRLVPLFVAEDHHVAGMTRSPEKATALRELGAEPVVSDVYDSAALERAMVDFRPDAIIDLLTDLPDDLAETPNSAAANARIRREGTRNVIAAARAAGAVRIYAESVAWPLGGASGAAVEEHERSVLAAGGVVLRYGRLYGPGTYYEREAPPPPRIHVDEAARRTVAALETSSGVITIVEA
jgi:nucleoside-diphosphate-sugar epimerase